MALVACRECGKNISTEARKCIGCGVPNPTSKKKRINKDTSAFTFIEKVKYFLTCIELRLLVECMF
jgi:ribosomal protein L37E